MGHGIEVAKVYNSVANFMDSAEWQRARETTALFPQFSYNSRQRILNKMPMASAVTTAGRWEKIGAQVTDDVPVMVIGKNHYYDISQTTATVEDLNSVRLLTGDAPEGLIDRMADAIEAMAWTLRVEDLHPNVNGETRHKSRSIILAPNLSGQMRVKTLAHEMAHAILHRHAFNQQEAEVEAESVAYLVCDHLGVDSSAYTYGYVASWAQERTVLDSVLDGNLNVYKAATEILERLD